MTTEQALAIFSELEAVREIDLEDDVPTYDVRLDASTNRETARRYARVRVTAGRETGGIEATDWRLVLDIAERHGITCVNVANDGIELS